MTILVVRHTSVNMPTGICYGQTDVNLASTFENETNKILEKLSSEHFQAVYASPLIRCSELAGKICRGIPVVYDTRLMELDFGLWEGRSWNEISQTKESNRWFSDWKNEPCPGGESYQQLITRVQGFLQHVVCYHLNETVLVVTHAGVIRSMISLVSGIDPTAAFDEKIDFGSITKLNIHG